MDRKNLSFPSFKHLETKKYIFGEVTLKMAFKSFLVSLIPGAAILLLLLTIMSIFTAALSGLMCSLSLSVLLMFKDNRTGDYYYEIFINLITYRFKSKELPFQKTRTLTREELED